MAQQNSAASGNLNSNNGSARPGSVDMAEAVALMADADEAGDDEDEETDEGGRAKAPSIIVSVPNEIDIPSVAAILRKALKASSYRGVKVRESVDAGR